MKKIIVSALLTLLAYSGAFSLDLPLSAGAGGLFGYTFTRYTLKAGDVESRQTMDRTDYGVFLFFDAAYAALSVLFQGGQGAFSENMLVANEHTIADTQGTGYETSLGFSLMGKYPITVNDAAVWFPMLGLEYHLARSQRRMVNNIVYDRTKGLLPEDRDKDDKPYPLSAWNSLWVNLGAGLDYTISDPFFLRTELIFGFRLPTAYENGALELVKKQTGISNPSLSGLTRNPKLKLAAGYRL